MQRLFFHNSQDFESREQLKTLPLDFIIYDVFGGDRYSLPQNIKLTSLPYVVDKQITLKTQSPYAVGIVLLQFQCKDYQDNDIQDNLSFIAVIEGEEYEIMSVNGIIEIELDCPAPTTISIDIYSDGNGYLPFNTKIEVVESAT